MTKYKLDTKLDFPTKDVVYQLNRLRMIRQPHLELRHVEDEFRTLSIYFRGVNILNVDRASRQLIVTFISDNEDVIACINDIFSTLNTGKVVMLDGMRLVDAVAYDNTI